MIPTSVFKRNKRNQTVVYTFYTEYQLDFIIAILFG